MFQFGQSEWPVDHKISSLDEIVHTLCTNGHQREIKKVNTDSKSQNSKLDLKFLTLYIFASDMDCGILAENISGCMRYQ